MTSLTRPRIPLPDAAVLRGWVLQEHLSPAAIAARLGVSPTRVRTTLRALGLPCHRARLRITHREQALSRYYALYQQSAARRSHVFALSLEHFTILVSQPCFYCGGAPSRQVGAWRFSGIDRIESGGGYTPDNVRPCCGTCNLAKRRMSEQDFIAWVLRAAAHLKATQDAGSNPTRREEEPS